MWLWVHHHLSVANTTVNVSVLSATFRLHPLRNPRGVRFQPTRRIFIPIDLEPTTSTTRTCSHHPISPTHCFNCLKEIYKSGLLDDHDNLLRMELLTASSTVCSHCGNNGHKSSLCSRTSYFSYALALRCTA